jgi:hypothetical protein
MLTAAILESALQLINSIIQHNNAVFDALPLDQRTQQAQVQMELLKPWQDMGLALLKLIPQQKAS